MASRVTADPIFIVWAEHGDYSSRTEYAVCWYDVKADAETRVGELVAGDAEWSGRVACAELDYGDMCLRATAALRDPLWMPGTCYRVIELQHGGVR